MVGLEGGSPWPPDSIPVADSTACGFVIVRALAANLIESSESGVPLRRSWPKTLARLFRSLPPE